MTLPKIDRSNPDWQKQYISKRWLDLGDTSQIKVKNPFDHRTVNDIDNPHIFLLSLMRRPENFFLTCKLLFNITLRQFQQVVLKEFWYRPFPMLMGSRGCGKSFLLGLYALLRATFTQGSKVCITAASFRQSKAVFEYASGIWHRSPVFRSLVGDLDVNGPRWGVDRCTFRIGESIITAIPLGDGSTVRGQRATDLIVDEFASVPIEIYENVLQGFSSVSPDPVEQSIQFDRLKAMRELGIIGEGDGDDIFTSNRSIISGTCSYSFNHFFSYWVRWKNIIESRGEPEKLKEVFGGESSEGLNWKDFSVIRLPVEILPPKFMDPKNLAKSRATIHSSIYSMEFGSVMCVDSNGFYKASLIDSCVVGKRNATIEYPSCGEALFNASLTGDLDKPCVMGIDPASESDNFTIFIVQMWPDHRRILFGWSTTRKRYKEKFKNKLTEEKEFYHYVVRKARDLMKFFPVHRIALDTQGGGISVIEAFQNTSLLKQGEKAILPTVDDDPKKAKPTDEIPGEHILELISFAKATWVSEANHGLRKDFEDKTILFPQFDSALLGLAIEEDKLLGRVDAEKISLYDTLEDCMLEIEELKDELATIVHTQTGTSLRDHFDTPEVKQPGSKKGRMRKDRYSALLMANMVARQLQKLSLAQPVTPQSALGGFAGSVGNSSKQGPLFVGPDWWCRAASQAAQAYGTVAGRG